MQTLAPCAWSRSATGAKSWTRPSVSGVWRWAPNHPAASSPAIDRGVAWLVDHFPDVFEGQWRYYGLYGVERIGVAGGYKYLGKINWYQQGAEHLIEKQTEEGSWKSGGPALADTAFGLLFLRAVHGLLRRRRAVRPQVVGLVEMGFGVLTVTLLTIGYRLGV